MVFFVEGLADLYTKILKDVTHYIHILKWVDVSGGEYHVLKKVLGNTFQNAWGFGRRKEMSFIFAQSCTTSEKLQQEIIFTSFTPAYTELCLFKKLARSSTEKKKLKEDDCLREGYIFPVTVFSIVAVSVMIHTHPISNLPHATVCVYLH